MDQNANVGWPACIICARIEYDIILLKALTIVSWKEAFFNCFTV